MTGFIIGIVIVSTILLLECLLLCYCQKRRRRLKDSPEPKKLESISKKSISSDSKMNAIIIDMPHSPKPQIEKVCVPFVQSNCNLNGNEDCSEWEPKGQELRKYGYVPVNMKQGSIIIVVDSTSKLSGGYLISSDSNVVQYYSIDTSRLPWQGQFDDQRRGENELEFQMINLLFALLNWEREITTVQNLSVYMDNSSFRGHQGFIVKNYLNHFEQCCDILINNKGNHFLDSHCDSPYFAKFIGPAHDLSRDRLLEFFQHIKINFPHVSNKVEKLHIGQVQQSILNWVKLPCGTCGFGLKL